MNDTDKNKAIELLNKIMELELAGVVRYTHPITHNFNTSA